MKILDIELVFWIEWIIWLFIWIALLIITKRQIKIFTIDAQIVIAAVGNRRASQDDIRKSRRSSGRSNIATNVKHKSRRASLPGLSSHHHRNSSRRLSLQTAPRRYSLNLRPQSMGYQLRKKKLQLQLVGIIGNLLIHLLLFPYFRFSESDIFIRLNVIFTYIPCFCGTCFYVLDIYLSALKTFSLHHLFNETQHRNVNIYIQLKSLQNYVKSITSLMCIAYAISILGVAISKLMIFWTLTELSCFIIWYLLYNRYKAIKSLYKIISTDLKIANRKILEIRLKNKSNPNSNQNKVEIVTNSKSPIKEDESSMKIDWGDNKSSTSPNSTTSNSIIPARPQRLSKISVTVEQSVSLKSSASDQLTSSTSASASKTTSRSSTPKTSIVKQLTRRVSLEGMISEITPDSKIRVSINAQSSSLMRQLSTESVLKEKRVSKTETLLRTVSNTLQSMVSLGTEDEFSSATTDPNIIQKKGSQNVNEQIVKDQIATSKYEETIYNQFKDITEEKDMFEYIDNLTFRLKQIAKAGTMQFVFAKMWFLIGFIYIIRRIVLLSMDIKGEAIQFSYNKDMFHPMSFDIIPFLVLWFYAIYSSWK